MKMLTPSILRLVIWYIFITQTNVMCQVCVETKMDYHDVPETYLYTYMEAYEKSDCLFWCTDTRVATAMGTRTVRKLIPKQINVCCDGYVKDESYDGNSIHCKPYCSSSCINSYCKSPEVCACNPGYIPDMFDTHNCTPLCIKGCDHGTCTTPNTCLCDSGYDLKNDVCEPICMEPCVNGTCVAPETCQCLPGYKKSEIDTCEPYCISYTATGECISSIICEPGWTRVIKGSVETCEPECSEPCENGICIEPETCECLFGYEMSANGICEPYCFGCEHGTCVSPQMCVCDPGWYKKEFDGPCIAHCDHKCGNGTCIAPNICECFPGYQIDNLNSLEEKENAVCIPTCINCEGSCIAPDLCVCEPHQEMKLVTANGEPCDCTGNCFDSTNKCEKTICLTTTTVASVIEYEINEGLEAATMSTYVRSTIDVELDDGNIIEGEHSDLGELKIETASWFSSNWFYAMGSILLLAIIVSMGAILKRKYYDSPNRRSIFNTNAGQRPPSIPSNDSVYEPHLANSQGRQPSHIVI